MKTTTHRLMGMLGGLALLTASVTQANATLLVQYAFNEASSGTTTALNTGTLGSSADGTFSNNATRTSNTPLSFSLGALNVNGNGGNDDYVGPTADVNGVDALTAMTLTAWVNVQTSVSANNFTALADDFSSGPAKGWWWYSSAKGVTGSFTNSLMQLGLEVDGAFNDAKSGVTPVYIDASNKWVFVATVWDGSTVKFYSGTTNNSVTQIGDTLALVTSMTDNAALLRVGANPSTAVDRSHPGFMDDFRIYDSALSQTELESVRLANIPEPTSVGLSVTAAILWLARRRLS